MGMFDTIHVSKNLMENLYKDFDFSLQEHEGYYLFQTKDLDNSLSNYYIESDGSFVWEKQEYEYIEPVDNKKWFESPMRPVGDPEKIPESRSVYINCYDMTCTETERVFITLEVHINKGKLVEPILIKSTERTLLKIEREEHKKNHERWKKIESSFEWNLYNFIFLIRNRIVKILKPINNKLDEIEMFLAEKAKNRFK
jgi:hypothetical protein